ncbi:hypothetical protein PV325_000486 [Microctonus aethiopoides]|uniref:Uncharacterized protein n=1 Tax=Microctonus aethiopoides TaxID=144406 RepID=A0AA39FB84_9HYME|nr:hypothetical protein PV325_000486 [Microctonus aethiopoides]KAK0166204.1 hypothetical protein PV328_004645 [Microctonus aethiopoides]
MNLIGWLYFSLFVLALGDAVFATTQSQDIQKHITSNKQLNNDVTQLVDYILGSEPGFQGRTFGQKRIQFMLMPLMFKMGVMTTILIVLTVISLKGLTIGMILLLLKLSALFGKFYSFVQPLHQASGLSPAQPVHLYLHSDAGQHIHPYNAWESNPPSSLPDTEPYYYHHHHH